MSEKVVVVVSGGLDSTTLLYDICLKSGDRKNVLALSFAYGQKHVKELECVRWHTIRLQCMQRVIDLSSIFDSIKMSALVNPKLEVPEIHDVLGHPQPVTYVPNRNMIFLSVAAAVAEDFGAESIFCGIQRHDIYSYWDTTVDFQDRMNAVFSLNRMTQIRIEAPFVNKSKEQILEVGYKYGIDYSKTWSCYNGKDSACGTCPTCAERRKAFKDFGRVDPLVYNIPWES